MKIIAGLICRTADYSTTQRAFAWRSVLLSATVVAVAGVGLPHAQAAVSTWVGATGNWSSNISPGWNGTGVPDAIGAVANFSSATAGTTTVDASTRTVGTLTLSGSGNTQRSITNTAGLTFNNGGGGATISNTDTSTGTGNRLSFGSGTYTLADSLLISNTGGSTNTSGAITISVGLAGTGNLTVYNVSNDPNSGSISIGTGSSSTFSGNVLVEKGVFVQGGSTNALGASTNLLVIGSAGQGSASLYSSGSASIISNNTTITAGTGGTLTLGSTQTGATVSQFTGTMLLNDDVILSSVKTGVGTVTFTNTFSGVGGVTKVGTGSVTISGNAGYNGNTNINVGTLILAAGGTINNTPVIDLNGGSLDTTAKSAFTVGGSQEFMGQGTYAGATTTTINGTLSIGQTHNIAVGSGSTLTVSTRNIVLGGPDQFDLVSAAGDADNLTLSTGTLTYGGTLQIANPNGIVFASGQSWNLFDFASQSGAFANDSVFGTAGDGTNLPTLTGLNWDFDYATGVLSITPASSVPEPASLVLLSLGAIGLLHRRRR